MADDPSEILRLAFQHATESGTVSLLQDSEVNAWIKIITHNTQNRACARFILACALTKVHRPDVDIRKPYTEIGDVDSYSGHTYDAR